MGKSKRGGKSALPLKRLLSWIGVIWFRLANMRIGNQLGLVIKHRSINLCLVKQRLLNKKVIDIKTFQLEIIENAGWLDRIDAAAQVVGSYLKKRGLSKIPVNIGLSGHDIAFRRLVLPNMPAKELSQAVMWEGEKLFPFDFSRCQVHYEVVDSIDRGGIEYSGVNIVAAKTDIISAIYDRFMRLGLVVGQINHLPIYISSIINKATQERKDGYHLILYLDDEQSLAIFVHDTHVDFFQHFVTGLTAGDENKPAKNKLDAFGAELQTFLDLFSAQNQGLTVDDIILVGKYADQDTSLFFSENTGLPCRTYADDKHRIIKCDKTYSEQLCGSFAAITAGLANVNHHPLAPSDIRAIEEKRKDFARLAAVSILVLLIVGGLHSAKYIHKSGMVMDLNDKRQAIAAIESSSGYQNYLIMLGRLTRGSSYLKNVQDRMETHCHILLKELSLTLPDKTNLNSINFAVEEGKYILRLDGNVKLKDFSPEIILAQYVRVLEKSILFRNVTVTSHRKRSESGDFDLHFQVKMDAQV